MIAYLVIALALLHAVDARLSGSPAAAGRAAGIAGLALLQASLGIATLLLGVPLWAALAHQVLAMALLTMATVNARLSRGTGRVRPIAAAVPLGFEGLAGRGV